MKVVVTLLSLFHRSKKENMRERKVQNDVGGGNWLGTLFSYWPKTLKH